MQNGFPKCDVNQSEFDWLQCRKAILLQSLWLSCQLQIHGIIDMDFPAVLVDGFLDFGKEFFSDAFFYNHMIGISLQQSGVLAWGKGPDPVEQGIFDVLKSIFERNLGGCPGIFSCVFLGRFWLSFVKFVIIGFV